jgi:SAM-dependent methyltransferase
MSAAKQYHQIVKGIDFENKTVLDAGCGMGDLLPYIYSKSLNFDYLGLDVVPEFIDIAIKRYEGHRFMVEDPFSDRFKQHFDVVISCGVMNHNSINWLDNRKKMIAKLFSLSNQVLVFNMTGGFYNSKEVKNIAYASITEIFNFCSQLSTKIILRAQYDENNFTIVLFKP